MLEVIPWFVAMAVLIACSAFFSASEAALFSLRPIDRRILTSGTRSQRLASALLDDPERVLSAVLFWNLVINVAYFAIASILEHKLPAGSGWVWPLRVGALLVIIFCSEMLPKTIAVLLSRQLASLCSVPMSLLVRLVAPIMPTLSLIMLVSRRLLWPGFRAEESLATADLERAIELSTGDAKLMEQEQTVLRNIVALSDLRADEAMRPTTQLRRFRSPVALSDLEGSMTQSGYLFIVAGDTENISKSVRLDELWSLHPDHLEAAAEPVVYVPWCSTLAETVGLMLSKDRDVAVVVNEWGESIGALTIDDIQDVVFTDKPSRSERLLNREPIQLVRDGLWRATGMTNLRRMAEYFQVELPLSHRNTIAGIIQETLQRMPEKGDECTWGPFELEVVDVGHDGRLALQIRLRATEEEQ